MPSALDSILHRRGSATTGERYLRSRRIFSVAIMNNTVYQTTADGICTPFVTFDRMVWGIAFTPDGSRMLATLRGAVPIFSDGWNSGPGVDRGAIVLVHPDGSIDPEPIASTLRSHRPILGSTRDRSSLQIGKRRAPCLLICR